MKGILCFVAVVVMATVFLAGCGGGGGGKIVNDNPPISVPLNPPADGVIKLKVICSASYDTLMSMAPDGSNLKTVGIQNAFDLVASPSLELYAVDGFGNGYIVEADNDSIIETIPYLSPDYSWENETSLLVASDFDRIYRHHINGADETLIKSPFDELYHNPVASPDGTRIAYLHHTYRSCCDVSVMNADGTGKKVIAKYATGFNRNLKLKWLDNNSIVYLVDHNPFPQNGYPSVQAGIYIRNVDTGSHRIVFKVGDYDYFDFVLSPDRSKIALAVSGKMFLASTSNWSFAPLQPALKGVYSFCFSPSGQEIALGVDNSFFSTHNTPPGLWVCRMSTSTAQLVYPLKDKESSPHVIWLQ